MLGLTIVNNDRLYLGIGIEALIVAAIIFTLWAIVKNGFGNKRTYSFEKKKTVLWQLIFILIILIALFVLNWQGYISDSILKF